MIVEQQFTDIVSMIKTAQANAYRAVNTELINLYWNIGAFIQIHIENAKWGDKTVAELTKFIKKNNPDLKGFDRRGLYRMKQFYQTYQNTSIVTTALTQLQNTENQNNTIVSAVLTQFKNQDIRETVLAKIGWTNNLLIISQYTLALPNKEVLQNKLHEIYELFESRKNSEELKKEKK
jgi:hypothetical protein